MLDVLVEAEPLSQVVFIHDYIQLVFQQMGLSLYNPVTLRRGERVWVRDDLGYCDELCSAIGQRVVETSYEAGKHASLRFDGGLAVFITLDPNLARGPEAFYLADNMGLCVVEQNG